ncbi:MAG: ABC transporter ATP-binding protein [Planctomycetes bacterium]|nr:ABC transporter ATP-binding protein [Planctomycetota bacterium]
MSETALQAEKLTKRFPGTIAVEQLDLTVPRSSIFGLLGINGAGKTTLIRMVMGHLHPTSGVLTVLDTEPRSYSEKVRSQIAYVSENMSLPGHMTPEKAVAFNSSAYRKWDSQLSEKLLDDFELRGAGTFKTLSKGQKRKICILLAICQNADLLVMDEPAAGLDLVARRNFLNQVLEIACKPGRTVFISSHMLSDLERVVDRLTVIHHGRALITGDLENLKAGVRKIYLPSALSEKQFRENFEIVRFEQPTPVETLVTVTDFTEEKMSRFTASNPPAKDARIIALNLEDIFMELVGRHPAQANINQES